MKKITLKQTYQNENTYQVLLGNGTKHVFVNKRAADNFLVATSKFLTQIYYEAYKLYKDVNRHYDNIFLLLDGHVITENKIQDDLQAIRNLLNRLYIKPELGCPPNYNFLSFINLVKICNYVQTVVKSLNHVIKGRSDTLLVYDFNSIIDRSEFLKSELSKYGKKTSESVFDVPENVPFTHEIDHKTIRLYA